MNKKGKILVAVLAAIVVIVTLIVLIPKDEPPAELEWPIQGSTGEYVRTSTKSWANRAWLNNTSPSKIKSIYFVQSRPDRTAKKAWMFDGLSCYLYDDSVYVVVGKNLKITGSMNGAFSDLSELTAIGGFDLIDTSEVKDMSNMFKNCSSLGSVSIQDLETDSLLLTNSMFQGCSGLTELDMTDMNMENVIDMDYMFSECGALENLYLPKTKDVLSMKGTFEDVGGCFGQSASVHGVLNAELCEDMSYMFAESKLTDYRIAEELNTKSLINAEGMFYDANVISIDLSNWDTSEIKTTKNMFWRNEWLDNCDMSGWKMSSLIDCEGMFYFCTNLQKISLRWEDVNNIQNSAYLFKKCFQLQEVDVSCFDNVIIGDAREMFWGCENMTTIYGTNILANVSDRMFEHCLELKGAIEYSESRIDGSYANINGYLTRPITQ